jgi:hypothetical protein
LSLIPLLYVHAILPILISLTAILAPLSVQRFLSNKSINMAI